MRKTAVTHIEVLPKRKYYPRKGVKRSLQRSKPKKRRKSRTNLVKALDAIFSQYIRRKYATKSGKFVKCYTCPNTKSIKKMQNGHYVSRSVRSLRWSEENCRPQCYGCNVMHGGMPITFRENLVAEYGEEVVKKIEANRHVLFKPNDEWLVSQINLYTEKLKNVHNSTNEESMSV